MNKERKQLERDASWEALLTEQRGDWSVDDFNRFLRLINKLSDRSLTRFVERGKVPHEMGKVHPLTDEEKGLRRELDDEQDVMFEDQGAMESEQGFEDALYGFSD